MEKKKRTLFGLSSWNLVYAIVLLSLAVQILLFYLFSTAFS